MKELIEVIEKSLLLANSGSTGVVATIVRTRGSTYRRPGARMLIEPDGTFTGFISAGCLESDLFEHAKRVLATSKPARVSYDTTSEDDIIWGLGLGCNGFVDVLLEPLSAPNTRAKLDFLSRSLQTTSTDVLVTVVDSTHPDAEPGSYLMIDQQEKFSSDIKNPGLRAQLQREIQRMSQEAHSGYATIEIGDYRLELTAEMISPPVPLTIFGAGPDVVPILALADSLGWNTTVIDKRPEDELRRRFPKAHSARTLIQPIDVEALNIAERSVVLIMTHNYLVDTELLRVLLPAPVLYIGLLGPKRRGDQILEALRKENVKISEERLSRFHSPVGLDIGSESSIEIALSIVSEIQAVLSKRSGGFLRDRNAPIHNAHPEE